MNDTDTITTAVIDDDMSGVTDDHDDNHDDWHDAGHDDGHGHATTGDYVKIAIILAVITGIEVFTYFESVLDWGAALVPSLIVMMILKFYLVAMWFMHLKYDNKIFKQLFVTGLVLAVVVYLLTLTAFEFWSNPANPFA